MRLTATVIAIGMFVASGAYADVITLKNGRVINGTYLGGSPRQVQVQEGDQIETLEVSDIVRIEFGNAAQAARSNAPSYDNRPVLRRASPPPSTLPDDRPTLMRGGNADPGPASASASVNDDSGPPVLRRQAQILRPDAEPSVSSAPAPAEPQPIQISAGTNLVVRMIDPVDSEKNTVGQTFRASMDQMVSVNGQTVIPRGADVMVKLVEAKQSGTFTGRTELTLELQSITVNGKSIDVNTQSVTRESSARGQQTAKTVGGGAVLGTIIGAVAGGGKGAAVGAAAGAGAGAAVEVVTKGQKVKVPSETRLTFVLDNPINI